MWDRAVVVLSTWFGCGRAPKAPGTFGTLGAIPLVWVFAQFDPLMYMGLTLVFSVLAITVAQFYELSTGRHDSPEVVIDEVAGFLVTMTWVPFTWTYLLLGFVIFRVLDIAKPFPISVIDRRVPGGIGAVGDDLAAGMVANVLLQVILQYGVL